MENFTFYSPTKFVFGKGTESQAGELVKAFGGSKVLYFFMYSMRMPTIIARVIMTII